MEPGLEDLGNTLQDQFLWEALCSYQSMRDLFSVTNCPRPNIQRLTGLKL